MKQAIKKNVGQKTSRKGTALKTSPNKSPTPTLNSRMKQVKNNSYHVGQGIFLIWPEFIVLVPVTYFIMVLVCKQKSLHFHFMHLINKKYKRASKSPENIFFVFFFCWLLSSRLLLLYAHVVSPHFETCVLKPVIFALRKYILVMGCIL